MKILKRLSLAFLLGVFLVGCAAIGNRPTPSTTPGSSETPTATVIPSPSPSLIPSTTPTPNPYGIDWLVDCEDDLTWNGYWFHDVCLPGIVTTDFWMSTGPTHYVGTATFYSEGMMEKVAENRGLSLVGYSGGIATMFCGNIGRTAYVRPFAEGHWRGPYLVVDCSARQHLFYNIAINEIALEVDWNTAQRWGMTGGIAAVHVCLTYPDCGPAVTLQSYLQRYIQWDLSDE